MTPHDAAHLYARRGWRVVPILAGTKRPAINRWTEYATTDTAAIDAWWGGEYAECGVGIVTGQESGIWVLDVDDPDSLADLEARYEPLPATLTSLTGSGGTHIFFRWPTDGRDIRNDAGRRLGPKLDIRGNGGQVVAAPSIHPTTGVAYAWDAGMPDEPVDAPAWLLDLVTMEERTIPKKEAATVARSDRPGDRWAAATPWPSILEPDGWTLHHVDRDGEHYWVRPGKDVRDGPSATTGYAGGDSLKVFTTSLTHVGLNAEETYSKLGYLAATRFDGDHTAAAKFLAAEGWGDNDDDYAKELEAFLLGMESSRVERAVTDTVDALPEILDRTQHDVFGGWRWINLAEVMANGWNPPVPEMLLRDDGRGLLYRGMVHSIAGEPGGGKTWVALAAIAERVRAGERCLMIDYEDTAEGFTARMVTLGLTAEQVGEYVDYIDPDGPVTEADLARIDAHSYSLAVIDSVGESLAVEGESPNDDDAVARWFRTLPRRLARNGTTVLLVDHQAKNRDSRGLWAIGSQRKMAAINGAAYVLEVIKAPTKEEGGLVRIICAKDRHGSWRKTQEIALVRMSKGEQMNLTIEEPLHDEMPHEFMQIASEFLREKGPNTLTFIRDNAGVNKDKISAALKLLVEHGFAETRTKAERGGGTLYVWLKDYTEETYRLGGLSHSGMEGRAERVAGSMSERIEQVAERVEKAVDNPVDESKSPSRQKPPESRHVAASKLSRQAARPPKEKGLAAGGFRDENGLEKNVSRQTDSRPDPLNALDAIWDDPDEGT